LDELSDAVGEESARKIIAQNAKGNNYLFYDGDARVAHIIKSRHVHDNENSDLLCLESFGLGSACWTGPSGMRIRSVQFKKDEVSVSIYGEMQTGSRLSIIPESAAETYAIPWPIKTRPASGHFLSLIRSQSTPDQRRFYALADLAKEAFKCGDLRKAQEYAEELLSIAADYKDDWNYGNAIHDANLVLGRIAVDEGRIDDAKRFLIKAGNSPGSPQLDSFGPKMELAKELLERNEKEVVLQYFELVREFWKGEKGRLDRWSREVKAGKVPDFGANSD
jgi:hypothetical protein